MAAAKIQLEAKGSAQMLTGQTDSQGNYNFSALNEGVYTLRAEMTGYREATVPDIFLRQNEAKEVDLRLLPAAGSGSQPVSAQVPQFFDPPRFSVSGVTDTTSLGGHGPDTVVRTRETLAKEAVSLGATPAVAQPTNSAAKEKLLRETIDHAPNDFAANRDLGKLLIENGRARDAIPYLERARQVNPEDYLAAYDLALANADVGDYDRAREVAQALLPHHDKAELHHLLGDVQEKLGHSLEAVHEYQHAAELDPNEAYLFDWGSELLLHHAPEPAQQVFSQGNRLYPASVRMLIGLGAAWFAQGTYDQAVKWICQASDLNPDDATPYLFLGKIQSAEKMPSEALVDKLHRFVTRQPQSAQANYYYAVGLWKRREKPQDADVAQVESLLNHAVQIDPKFGPAYLQLGILHAEQENLSQAVSNYQQAIRSSPQLEEAHYRLAQAYRQVGEADKAKEQLQIYDRMVKESAEKVERERHEIRQFVYTLRDPSPAQAR